MSTKALRDLVETGIDQHSLLARECSSKHMISLSTFIAARAELDALESAVADERQRRIYYQDIVYAVCNSLNAIDKKGPGYGIVCGTVNIPSTEVQERMKRLESAVADARREAVEECAKAVEDADCLSTCDSFDHDNLCPNVFPENAIRALLADGGGTQESPLVKDLALLVRRLAHKCSDPTLAEKARDALTRWNLQGSPLRADGGGE